MYHKLVLIKALNFLKIGWIEIELSESSGENIILGNSKGKHNGRGLGFLCGGGKFVERKLLHLNFEM